MACNKKVIEWIVKAVGMVVLALMIIVGIMRFTYKPKIINKKTLKVVILYYVVGIYLIILGAFAIANMFKLPKISPLFKVLQTMRGRGIFMAITSFLMLEWKIKIELAGFILMLLVGAGFIVYSCVVKEEDEGISA